MKYIIYFYISFNNLAPNFILAILYHLSQNELPVHVGVKPHKLWISPVLGALFYPQQLAQCPRVGSP